jgi:hypothetical protein
MRTIMLTGAMALAAAGVASAATAAVVAFAAFAATPSAAAPDEGMLHRGRLLFHGEQALTGTVPGHDTPLPTAAARCANCHSSAPATDAAATAATATASAAPRGRVDAGRSFGPNLSAAFLTQQASRRGGPASRFDQASFCKLLETGIDPAYIVIAQAMPRYRMAAGDCAAVWAYLTRWDTR